MLHFTSPLTVLTIHSGLALTAQAFACIVGQVSAHAMVLFVIWLVNVSYSYNCSGVRQAKQLRACV